MSPAIERQNRVELIYGQAKAKIESAVNGNNCRFSCFFVEFIDYLLVRPAA